MIFSKGLKLVVLDEADAMTNDAQAALRRGASSPPPPASLTIPVIEKYTQTTRFCLICNHVGKIAEAIQSRCTKFRFSPLGEDQIMGRLRAIIESEKYELVWSSRALMVTVSTQRKMGSRPS